MIIEIHRWFIKIWCFWELYLEEDEIMRVDKDFSFEVPYPLHDIDVDISNKAVCCRLRIDFTIHFLTFFGYIDVNNTIKGF